MRWQETRKTLCIGAALSLMGLPLVVSADGPLTRTTSVIQDSWEDRPRFFTAEEGEEHSRFANMFWYERPRFFTKAPGEERSRFGQIWYERPRIFTTRSVEYSPAYTYPATTVQTANYRNNTGYHDAQHKNCECPHKRQMKLEQTSYMPPTNSYGGDIHRNVTETVAFRESRFQLTSDIATRSLDALISTWPHDARVAAIAMEDKYGAPDSSTSDRLIWQDEGHWAEIIVFRNGASHSFPTPHMDVLAQSIYFDVDSDDLDELNQFQGNVKIDYARGLLTSMCKDEAGNFLAMNLAHEILTGERSAAEANNLLAEKVRAGVKDDQYMKSLMFDVGEEVDSEMRNIDQNVDVDVDVDTPD